MSFDKLKTIDELREAAEDFAVELKEDEKKSKKLIAAALLESGVTFEDYLKIHPEQREKYAPETIKKEEPQNVVTSEQVAPVRNEEEAPELTEVVTKEETPNLTTQQQWLVKMERKNPLFEVAGHRFTQEHPYALMSAEDAEVALREHGFRQAYPSEIAEYYG